MCFVCNFINWIISFLFLGLIGVLLYKLAVHRYQHGVVTAAGVATDGKFWFYHDNGVIVAFFLFPLIVWSLAALMQYVLFTTVRFTYIGLFSGARAIVGSTIHNRHHRHHQRVSQPNQHYVETYSNVV